jgi:hypothetical protein
MGVLNGEWRPKAWLGLGFRGSGGYGTGKLTSFESQAYGRWYFARPGSFEFFIQGGAGLLTVFRETDPSRGSFSWGLSLGARIALKNWYLEPYIRGGYPFIGGTGLLIGYRFPKKERKGELSSKTADSREGRTAAGGRTGPVQAALFPFEGEDRVVNSWYEGAVSAVIEGLGHIPVRIRSTGTGYFPPDEPPPRYMTDERYTLTGAVYPEEGEYHLQLWLWDMEEPTLIYTDEMVSEEVADSSEFVELLVDWLFSHL